MNTCELCQKEIENGFCEECERVLTEEELNNCNNVSERLTFLIKILNPRKNGILRVLGFKKNELNKEENWQELIKGREGAAEILADVLTKWLEYYNYNSRLASEKLVEPENYSLRFLPQDTDAETAWLTMFWVCPNREETCIKVILGRQTKELSNSTPKITKPNVIRNYKEFYPITVEKINKSRYFCPRCSNATETLEYACTNCGFEYEKRSETEVEPF